METDGRDPEPLNAPDSAGGDAPASPGARPGAWIERPGGRAAVAGLVAAASFAVTIAVNAVRRVPEGWVGVRGGGAALLEPGARYFALRASSVQLFPTTLDLKEAELRMQAAGGESLRGRLDLRGELRPEVAQALAAAPAGAPPPPERARAAGIEAVARALANRDARELIESSPLALQVPRLTAAGVERGLKLASSNIDLVSVPSVRAVASRLRERAGDDAAGRFLRALAARRPRDAAPLCVEGDLARLQGDAVRAETLYLAALDLDPALPEAMEALLVRAQQSGEGLERAGQLLHRALAARPDSIPHLNWLSLVLARRGDLPGAEGALVRALSFNPDDATSAINLASLMDRRGRRDEAIDQLRRVLQKHPDHPMALYNLGSALAEQGDLDGAIATLEHAAKVSRPSYRLYNRLAMAYEKRGDAVKAAEYRERAARLARERQLDAAPSE